MNVTLYSSGREYVKWPYTITGSPSAVEVGYNGTWYPAAANGTEVSILIAGPDATANPGGTLVLPVGVHDLEIRFTVSPELIVRAAGTVTVVRA